MIRKVSSILILCIFSFTTFFGPFWQAKQVEAQFVVSDPVNTVTNLWQNIAKQILEPVLASIVDRVVNKLVDDTLNWANNGFDGNPGFINNWDDFLKKTQYELISGAFDAATTAAGKSALKTATSPITNYENCRNKTITDYKIRGITTDQEEYIQKACGTKPQLDPKLAAKIKSCDSDPETLRSYINTIGHRELFQGYLNVNCEPIQKEEIPVPERNQKYNKCLQAAPEKYLRTKNLFNTAEQKSYSSQKCDLIAAAGDLTRTGQLVQIAQANYETYKNSETHSTREIARNIASYGFQQIAGDKLNDLLKSQGSNLSTILGQNGSSKEEFEKNITAGGWQAYIALADPHNYDAGLQSLITEELSKRVSNAVENKISDVQTENKFIDKIDCIGIKIKGKCQGKTLTKTPGTIVGDSVSKALGSDFSKAASTSGTLANSLVNGIGRLTDGLLQVGLSKISEKASKAFFQTSDINKLITNAGVDSDYRSEYDVLGIKPDTSFSQEFSGEVGKSLEEEARIKSMIGGPEDQTGNPKDDPQIVVNLKDNLENAIENGKKESEYYNKISTKIDEVKKSAADLDQCLPGPDYGWQERYEKRLEIRNEDSKEEMNNALGLAETEEMASDPLVNIPGSAYMADIFKRVADGDIINNMEVNQRKEALKNATSTLNKILIDINRQIDGHRKKLNLPDLILFRSDWVKFDQARKIQAFQTALDKGYAVIPEELAMTTEQYVSTFDEKARDAVINMSWEIWRRDTPKAGIRTGENSFEAGKQDVRYPFYIISQDISTEAFVETAHVREQQFAFYASEVPKLLNDCLILKLYTIGGGLGALPTPDQVPKDNSIKQFETYIARSKKVLDYGTQGLGMAFAGPVGLLGGKLFSKTASFAARNQINLMPDRGVTDTQVINFLKTERQKQLSGQTSYFVTDYLTDETAIKNSILGFDPNKYVQVETLENNACYPTIYRVARKTLSNSDVVNDYTKDTLDIEATGGSGASSSSTTYIIEPTGNTCSSGPSRPSSCSSSGELYCESGSEYVCRPQTTASGSGGSGGSVKGDYDPKEEGDREEIGTEYIYIDNQGYQYAVTFTKTTSKTGTNGTSVSVLYREGIDKRINLPGGKLPGKSGTDYVVAAPTNCKKVSKSVSEKDDYFLQNYPYDDDFYADAVTGKKKFLGITVANDGGAAATRNYLIPAKTVFQIFQQDRILGGNGLSARMSGILYCRNRNGIFSCTNNWYTATELNYRVLFSGI